METKAEIRTGCLVLTESEPRLLDQVEAGLFGWRVQPMTGTFDAGKLGQDTDALALWITVRSPIGAAEMDLFPNLGIIVTASTGYDHVDLSAAKQRGITVCNVPRYGPAVAEFNMALIFALTRKVHLAYMRTLQDEFALSGLIGRNLGGKTLGVIGAGNIGQTLLRLAKGFEMRLLAYDPMPNIDVAGAVGFTYESLDALLSQSDIIAICCPLTKETEHLIGKSQFEKMKRGVLIVNTSRGAVIDTQALVWALDEGIVEGAALDVLEAETRLSRKGLMNTLKAEAPAEIVESLAEDLTLMRHPRVIVTPHMAYYTVDSLETMNVVTIENIQAWAMGEPINVVN
jgi:D-lactate dehydrogenase